MKSMELVCAPTLMGLVWGGAIGLYVGHLTIVTYYILTKIWGND